MDPTEDQLPLEPADPSTDPTSNGTSPETPSDPAPEASTTPIQDPVPPASLEPAPITVVEAPVNPYPNLKPLDKERAHEISEKGHAETEQIIREKLEKIMALFDSPHHKTFYKTGLSNREVELALRVSHPTAARYLRKLVQERRLSKTGAGRFIRYKKMQ